MRRAGVDPAPSRFAFLIRHHHTMPTSPHRSRDAAWRALRDPELTASRHLRPSRTHRSTRKVQSSKSRCVERPLPSFPASARAHARHRSETRLSPPPPTFGGVSGGRRGAHRATRQTRTSMRSPWSLRVARRSASSAAARGDLRVVRSRPSRDRSAYPEREQNDKGIFSEASDFRRGFATRTSEDAFWSE